MLPWDECRCRGGVLPLCCVCGQYPASLLCCPGASPAGLLRLFGLVPQADAGSCTSPLLTILHADLLACWCQLGGMVTPLLQELLQQQQQVWGWMV